MSSNNDTYNLSQYELNKKTKKDIREILVILKDLSNEMKDLKTEMNAIKKDVYSKPDDDALNKLNTFERRLLANEEISRRTAHLANNLQLKADNDAKTTDKFNTRGGTSIRSGSSTRAVDTSSVLESNVIQYIEYQVDSKIDSKLENVNNEINNIRTDTNSMTSKIVSLARSIGKK
jgi:hypothetical protein